MSNGWKYGLIKVAIEDEGTDFESQVNLLVELYPLGDDGDYAAWCVARPQTLEELEMAQRDIQRDGINEHFFDNGTFVFNHCEKCGEGRWDYVPNDCERYDVNE